MKFEPYKDYYKKLVFYDRVLGFFIFINSFFLLSAAIFGVLSLYHESWRIFGAFGLFFLLFLFLETLRPFREENLRKTVFSEKSDNLADFLSFELKKIFIRKKPKNANTLLYYVLKDFPETEFIFSRFLLSFENAKKNLEKFKKEKESEEEIYSLVLSSLEVAKRRNKEIIEKGDILIAGFSLSPLFFEILSSKDVFKEDLENLVFWLEFLEREKKEKRFFGIRGSIGRKWISGYSLTIDTYGIDITKEIRNYVEFISHKKEIKVLENALVKSMKSNALIVGDPGSGRKSVVYNLAQRCLFGRSFEDINYKRVIEVDMISLLAKIQDREEVEFTLEKIFNEASFAKDIILVINNIHEFVGVSDKLGTVDITGIITNFLNAPHFKFIGITDYSGLHQRIEKNESFLSLFEKIEISEVTKEDTLKIIQSLTPYYEKKYRVFVSYFALKEIIDISDKYLTSLFFPEKGIDLLEEVVLFVSSLRGKGENKIVLASHVDQIISRKTDIPIGDVKGEEKDILLNLEKIIHKRIINQEEAVREVSSALRRSRTELKTRKGPMGSFLFLGPTGVGKTEVAKALADNYFDSEKKIIRLDMSEFQSINDIPRLIGGKNMTGMLTAPVKESPFSLILLDELEKANKNIFNIFLQILDEGHVTDGFERKIDFKNTIIIATSNAGYQIILDNIEKEEPWENVKKYLFDYVFKNNIFKPEFINRFDATVIFKPLSKENLLDISTLILSSLKKNLEKKRIELIINERLKEKIVELSYNPKFGAREMRRVIQDKIENKLAEALLQDKIKKGDKIELDPETFEIVIKED